MGRQELESNILELQRRINRALRQNTLDAWIGLNLTIAQLKSLFFIANEGSVNFTRLAAALRTTPSSMTGIVDRLVKQGLVTRQENPEDRRMLLLRATDKGEDLVANLRERGRDYMSQVLGRMALDDLSALARGLECLARAAESHEGKTPDEHD